MGAGRLAIFRAGLVDEVEEGILGQAGGLTNDETGVDFADSFELSVNRLETREQIVDGLVCEVFAGHADGGEWGDGVFGEMDVVETDEREVVGDLEFGFEESVLNADGSHVVGAHDGGGMFG